jgi:hypothetical protein
MSNSIVVLDKEDYTQKIEELLLENEQHLKVPKTCINKFQKFLSTVFSSI